MLRSLVYYSLVVVVAVIAYVYLNDFFVYVGEPIYVTSVYGKLKGRTQQIRGGRRIYSFTSIPYAKPPLGDLRFEAPEPYGNWESDETLDATKSIKLCTQYDTLWKKLMGQEDCLQLHVYTPNVDKAKGLLPVMVWFHGGHFMFGGNDIYGPQYLLEEGNVVLVSVNYRLNSLGFLSTGDGVISGNQGLKDQNLALKWVKSAIKDFGGDPNSVTLFGCSAGGASVSYHILSPMSKGLFHKAITQSGSGLCPWAFTRNPEKQAKRLAQKLNCHLEASKSSLELVNCLRKKKVEEIVSVHKEVVDIFHDVDAIFGPTIEKADSVKSKGTIFLPDSPHKLYKSGQFNRVPLIAGVTSEEGCFRSPLVLNNEEKLVELNEKWSQVAPKTLLLYNDDPTLSDKVRRFYFGSGKNKFSDISSKKVESLTNMYSDRYFVGCTRDAASFHAQHAPTSLYYFTYRPDISYGYILETTPGHLPVKLEVILSYIKYNLFRHVLDWKISDYGVCHTDEMQSLFLISPLLAINENSPHYDFSRNMVKLWISFVKNGAPDQFSGVVWTPLKYDKGTNKTVTPLQYLRLGKVPAMIDEPFTARLKFWEDLNLPKN